MELEQNYHINVYVTYVKKEMNINGTNREAFLISIPEWKWSTEIGTSRFSQVYWYDNLKGNIQESLERLVDVLSERLSKIDFKSMFIN